MRQSPILSSTAAIFQGIYLSLIRVEEGPLGEEYLNVVYSHESSGLVPGTVEVFVVVKEVAYMAIVVLGS
jgi:hypothetical protein